MAERALEMMIERAADRKTFGKRLLRHVSRYKLCNKGMCKREREREREGGGWLQYACCTVIA